MNKHIEKGIFGALIVGIALGFLAIVITLGILCPICAGVGLMVFLAAGMGMWEG